MRSIAVASVRSVTFFSETSRARRAVSIARPVASAEWTMRATECAPPSQDHKRLPQHAVGGERSPRRGDRLFTPFSNYIGMSGIEIHANVIRTVLDRSFLVPLGPVGEFAVSLLLIGLCVTAILRLRGIRLLLTFLGIGVLIVAAGFASIPAGYVLPLASFLAVCLVASSIAGVSEYVLLSKALAGETEKRKEYSFRVQAIAHEIKTPLTAIQGSSEMMSEGLVPEDQRARMAGLSRAISSGMRSSSDWALAVSPLPSQ